MRLNAVLPLLLASLPLAAGASALASASVRIVSREWLAGNDPRLLAPPRTVKGASLGTIQENGVTYILLDLKGNLFRFEVPLGADIPKGPLHVDYIPLYDHGHQRRVALTFKACVLQ